VDLYDRSLSYVSGTSDLPLIGSTIGDLFDRVVDQVPENEALVSCHQGIRLTYRQLQTQVNRFASALISLGARAGDRVGIWAPNCAEWVITQLATPKIGAIMVNINPAYRTSELEYALRQSGTSVLVFAPRFKSSDYAGMLSEICPELATHDPGALRAARLPDLRTAIVLDSTEVPGVRTWESTLQLAESVSHEQLLHRQSEQSFDDPVNIQYTSGTTGFPKGATLSHHNILNNGFFIGEKMRFTHEDRLANCPPLYHCFGSVLGNLACITHGATIVLPSAGFDPAIALQAVQAERCTALHGVPTMFIAELALPDFDSYDLSTLRTGIMAGSPCPIEVMKQVIERMHMDDVTICYGMTETSPVSTQTTADDSIEMRTSSVGRVHPHVEIKVVDPDTNTVVPRGTPGELCSRGYLVMLGYWNNQEATASAIDAGRWMHTGDLATMDDNGYLNIVGRIKDMIIRGGENVYPREIEEFLYGHPAIQDVQIIGVPDEKYGEEIAAWVIAKPGASVTEDDVKQYCRGAIAHFKVPRYVMFVDSFPMTVTGKIQKYRMRELSMKELGLGHESALPTA
jgi:fatty-acyl-CoA synthase